MIKEIQKYDSGLAVDKHNELAEEFNPLVQSMPELIEIAKSITVRNCEDIEAMKQARETRLALRSIRIDVEKTRKKLKEDSLRTGKAIDGMANVIKFLIEPVENELQEKEEYVRIAEQKRIEKLQEERESVLVQFEIDCQHFDLGNMKAEAFESLKNASEAGYKAKKQAEADEIKRQEEEAIKKAKFEKEQADLVAKLERERKVLEKAAAEERLEAQKKLDAERKAKEEADAKIAALEQEAEQKRLADIAKAQMAEEAKIAEAKAKAEAEAQAEQKRLSATDIDKLKELKSEIYMIDMPEVKSAAANRVIDSVTNLIATCIENLTNTIARMEK